MQVFEVYVFFPEAVMQAQDLKRVFLASAASGDCANRVRIAMLADHFVSAAKVGSISFGAGNKHYKKSKTCLFTTCKLLKKDPD
ncbi:hypothetical protein EI168_07340 [Halomonas sp. FME1]|uniref:Uncharacterized protein n=1 Tax=Halomonas casei TaxID=2742613 RepID=A0ABR9F0H3_9GAMM|nr:MULTISPECIES: hypothetical protein [Halomonas]MBE0399926.1 hypothetical protein [Halomonas casei]PCC23521.1 hypothetical protein CIK78_16500 [Halomonas sp. JB37]